MKVNNLIGRKFGKLLVIERSGSDKNGQALWKCICECGTSKIISGHDLISKKGTKSCGCSRRYNTGLYKHGLSNTRLHSIWRSIQGRCYNPKNKSFHFYGGRGIKVCNEWLLDFMSFYNWSINNGYQENLTIDRIDSNKNYCPENCRWVDRTQQANNTRRNRLIEHNGEIKTLSEWSKILDFNYSTVQTRMKKGYSFEQAIDKNFEKKKNFKSESNRDIANKCKEYGVSYKLVSQRIKSGWDLEKALFVSSRARDGKYTRKLKDKNKNLTKNK